MSAEEYILKELKNSGHPLELEIFSILRSTRWQYLYPQAYYYDEDEGKSRSIDITATEPPLSNDDGSQYSPLAPLWIQYSLVIECKKTKKNLIFFPTEVEAVDTEGQCMWFLEDESGGRIIDEFDLPYGLGHYSPKTSEVAFLYETLPYDSKNFLFEAIMQVIKYTSYSITRRREGIPIDDFSKYLVSIYYPIVIIDGNMWKANFEDGEIVSVEKIDRIVLQTQYYDKNKRDFKSYAIDVVNKNYFKNFLQIIQTDQYAIEKETIYDIKSVINKYVIDNRTLKHE